jgi:hypothetical protein
VHNDADQAPYCALLACTLLAAVLLAWFGVFVRPLIELPADLLMFSETAFVENMIKLQSGLPLYTAPSDSNSIVYNPGAFLATHAVAVVAGLTRSVPGLRAIQLGFCLLAAMIATACARELRAYARPDEPARHRATWVMFTLLAMMLVATAPDANRYTFALHVDASALLVSMACFWSLVTYYRHGTRMTVVAMAVLPALAFSVKQSLVIWQVLLVIGVLLKGRAHVRTAAVVAAAGSLCIGLVTAAWYAVWGDSYWFWAFTVLGGRSSVALDAAAPSISIPRLIDHLLRIWPNVAIGLASVWVLTASGDGVRRLGPFAVIWGLLFLAEAYASSSGWGALYHFGPGVLVSAVFLFASLPAVWYARPAVARDAAVISWARAGVLCSLVLAVFAVWNVVPSGDANHPRYVKKYERPADVYRYIRDIEREFEGLPADKVLLGVGSWIYLREGVLQKDRAVSLADQPPAGTYTNFDVTTARLRQRTYDKLLLQNFHTPYFLYEWATWPRESGFRAAVLEHYDEVGTIEPAQGSPYVERDIQLADPVSVFVPKRR